MASAGSIGGNDEAFFAAVFPLLSPAFFAAMSVASFVDDDPLEDYFIASLIWNTIIYCGALLAIRGYALSNASDSLDRPENPSTYAFAESTRV